ncbi:MAG: hypothetical protein EPO07_13265 [Verrucomicrobia bacterium]|nr:MAG: hypothetical protein EPO07_13265 [Verrucomicrobiota bacterium]
MNGDGEQPELFGLVWLQMRYPFRLRVNDLFRMDGRLCRVVRVNESAAVILMNRPMRRFTTRFDKPVRFQPGPAMFRISPNSEVEILNYKPPQLKKRKPRRN